MNNKKQTIVAVDDDTVMLAFLEHTLQPHYSFVSFSTTKNALAWLDRAPPVDLFLVDINIPLHDGSSFVRRIRDIARYAVTPVSLVSAIDPAQLEAKAKQLDVEHLLSKPFRPAELLDHVQTAIRSARPGK